MIADLLRDHETCARTAGWALALARTGVDAPTENLVTHRLMVHQKAAWMLRSLLADEKSLPSHKALKAAGERLSHEPK
jgi:starvation-inducible DNA-binding protein